jgi:hypothetical protein
LATAEKEGAGMEVYERAVGTNKTGHCRPDNRTVLAQTGGSRWPFTYISWYTAGLETLMDLRASYLPTDLPGRYHRRRPGAGNRKRVTLAQSPAKGLQSPDKTALAADGVRKPAYCPRLRRVVASTDRSTCRIEPLFQSGVAPRRHKIRGLQ